MHIIRDLHRELQLAARYMREGLIEEREAVARRKDDDVYTWSVYAMRSGERFPAVSVRVTFVLNAFFLVRLSCDRARVDIKKQTPHCKVAVA
jgi:hypothetical protein